MDASKYSTKYNEFTRMLLEKCELKNKDENIVLSPFSILVLLAIAALHHGREYKKGDNGSHLWKIIMLKMSLNC